MKKIFTLIGMALVAMSMNAQTTESYSSTIIDEGGNVQFAPEYATVCEPVMKTAKRQVLDENGEPLYDENGDPVTESYEIVDYYKATNVVDGASVVKISTAHVDVEAVGGAVPAGNEAESGMGASQAILADGTVTAWGDIYWNLKNHRTDINDNNGTVFYTVMGSGNPYVGISAEEIVQDDTPTGWYKAAYEYYEADGSKGMPLVGLYYKFTPKVAGTFKVKVWANKGNRRTFLVDESTKKAISYKAEGYLNGQNAKDENGENIQNAEGKNMMYFFDADSLQRRHDNRFVKVDETTGESYDSEPYIIADGGQAFWGWVTFEAEANKCYWLFQHSSQIGFCGFDFTFQEESGINSLKADDENAPVYNLAGQRMGKGTKGLFVKNGKKFIVK